MKKIIPLIFFMLLIWSCHKNAPEGSLKFFSEDFESYSDTAGMIGSSPSQWSEYNINEINISTNPISIDTTIVHSGNKSIRFECEQNDPNLTDVCKCNLNKGSLDFQQGEIMYYSAWYYIEHPDSSYGTFFIWDIGQVVHGSAEIRVMAWEENLELERNKIGRRNLFQPNDPVLFPVNRWVHFELEIKLSQYKKGYAKMWLDDQLIIDADKIVTMPKDRATLAWGTKAYYERVQVGITAKHGTQKLVMYVDDVETYSK
jgi:hypothetical protein